MSKNTLHCCRICGNASDNRVFKAPEMMFGWKETFEYFECIDCGCMQITAIPDNLGKYYPSDYYSFGKLESKGIPKVPRLRKLRNRALLGQSVPMGRLIRSLTRAPGYFSWLHGLGLDLDSSIIDIGCGTGSLLLRMRRAGFCHLTGLDPYIDNDIDHGGGLVIRKAEVASIRENFDLVMLHHSFEHMMDPCASLAALSRALTPNGALLIRIPIAGGYAARKYRQHWVNLDPPRHLHLHTVRSMAILAESCGLRIERVFFDSNAQQIVGSELFSLGIPLREAAAASNSMFNKDEIKAIDEFAKALNYRRDGDCAGFIMRLLAAPKMVVAGQ